LHGAAKAAPGVTDPTGRVFDALADPNRRYVVEALAERETATATELASELPVTRQAVAKHLAALNEAGLVESRREGRETLYELTPGPLAAAMDWIASVGAEWDSRLVRLRAHLTGGSPRRGGGARRRG
jgi:DNA-binding transcriptional ArsR family regulator